MNLNKIKLIIWDLDETFWNGTLSEGDVKMVSAHCDFVRRLTDRGIMNSICSKNDLDQVKTKLESEGLWDYFVFPSIDWSPKAKRIADIINRMSLRPVNVMFIDDNLMNLNEAKFYIPDLNVLHIDNIGEIIGTASDVGKDDRQHKRLKQYHQLEKKVEASTHFDSTDEFLLQSEIEVSVENNCIPYLGRIAEMVERTNQLNFTKIRSTSEELEQLMHDSCYECGAVSAHDKYGDYGIVGFYALNLHSNSLLHFLFSCRTMGMGIEQYIFEQLKFPSLNIKGDVSATLETTPKVNWINTPSANGMHDGVSDKGPDGKKCRILLKGPCDMDSILPYVQQNNGCDFETEFNYVDSRGVAITAMNHSQILLECFTGDTKEKDTLLHDAPFLHKGVFATRLPGDDYDIVFMSMLPDCHEGVYRHRQNGLMVPFSSFNYDFTNPENWDRIINGEITNHNFRFSRTILQEFSDRFEFIGPLPVERIVDNIRFLREKVLKPETHLVLILGSELECENPSSDEFSHHAPRHKEVNDALRSAFRNDAGIGFINITGLVTSQTDFKGATNHFSRAVYYRLACAVSSMVAKCAGADRLKVANPHLVRFYSLIKKARRRLHI